MTTYRERLKAGVHTAQATPADLTIDQLKAQLKDLGQPTSGNKDELAKRLEKAQKS